MEKIMKSTGKISLIISLFSSVSAI